MAMCEKEKDFQSIWVKSEETLYDSDGASVLPDSNSDLFDLNIESSCYFNDDSKAHLHCSMASFTQQQKLLKLKIVKLDSISITSTASFAQPIVNLKQSFTFPSAKKPSSEISTQTSQMALLNRLIFGDCERIRNSTPRASSLPPENIALVNLEKRVTSDMPNMVNATGDGQQIPSEQADEKDLRQPDLELADSIPPLPQSVSKASKIHTPKFNCKKNIRPQTRHPKKRPGKSQISEVAQEANECSRKKSVKSKEKTEKLCKKPENLMNYENSSDISTDGGLDLGGNYHMKFCNVIDKLQDHDWEVCLEGLRLFLTFAGAINWESELGQKFIPIISRKLIDFFKSPRSNLCRTACQTAGEFFLVAKSTKRPEFDEMVDILMCKTADSNRFIQKDALVALDKMGLSICVHHAVRAVCSKGPDHKNSVVRATAARLLHHICKNAGIEQIIGADANPRTRKRVLANLAKFLMDKNIETRRHAEKLCRMLKHHKFFMEYFFKDIENNYKNSLRKILNSLEMK